MRIEAKSEANSRIILDKSQSFKKNEIHRQSLQNNIWNNILEENDNYNE